MSEVKSALGGISQSMGVAARKVLNFRTETEPVKMRHRGRRQKKVKGASVSSLNFRQRTDMPLGALGVGEGQGRKCIRKTMATIFQTQ